MTSMPHRGRLVAAAAALLAFAAACGRSAPAVDAGLQSDLAAANSANSALVVTSPLELGTAGPKAGSVSAPKPAAHKNVTRAPAPAVRVARAQMPEAPAHVSAPVASAPVATSEPAAAAPVAAPVPAPQSTPAPTAAPAQAPAAQPHRGPYKTEAEIFQQMPWIRPL